MLEKAVGTVCQGAVRRDVDVEQHIDAIGSDADLGIAYYQQLKRLETA